MKDSGFQNQGGCGFDPHPDDASRWLGSADASVAVVVDDYDDDDEEVFGRTLTDEEYLTVLQSRRDIFSCENDQRLRNIQIVNMVLGIGFGTWVSTLQPVHVTTDFFVEKDVRSATRVPRVVDPPDLTPETPDVKEPPVRKNVEKRLLDSKRHPLSKTGGKNSGGDPRQHITSIGIVGILNGRITGSSAVTSDPLAKAGGYAEAIDGILAGLGGLKQSGTGGRPRIGLTGMGIGDGWESGFQRGGEGVGDPLAELMDNEAARGVSELSIRKPRGIQPDIAIYEPPQTLTGGRTKSSIQRIVLQNMQALRYAYSKRLREHPDLSGKITVKFAIDEFGKVIACRVESSTFDDPALETDIAGKIARWVFEKIDKPGDITEVVYPFVFTP